MANARAACSELGIACEIEEITDVDAVVAYGEMMTPALVIDGLVRSWGRTPTVEEIKRWLL